MSIPAKKADSPRWHGIMLKAAAIYSLSSGLYSAAFPEPAMSMLTVEPQTGYAELWRYLGITLCIYGVGYWCASSAPVRHSLFVMIGLLGKILGDTAVQLLPLPASKPILTGLLNAARPPQFLEIPAAELVSPLGLHARLDRLNLAQVYRRESIVGITDALLPRLVFQRLGLDKTALRQHLGSIAEDRALLRHAQSLLQKRVLEALGDEGTRKSLMGGGPIAPLLLDLSPDLLPPMPDQAEEDLLPAAAPALYATLALHEAISISNLATRREALREGAWGVAISGLSATALSLVEADALPADWLILDWSPALKDTQSLRALRRLDPARIILDGCDGEEALSWGLSQGIHLFGGPRIEDIITAGRMEYCSEAARCLRSECRARGLATAPFDRLGCHKPNLLEAVLPEDRS